MKLHSHFATVALAMVAMFFVIIGSGCQSSSVPPTAVATTTTVASADSQYRRPLLDNALHTLKNMANCDEEPALDQVIDRLNQWARSQPDDDTWKADPMIQALPEQFGNGPWFGALSGKSFDHDYDGRFLEESAWLADVSRHASEGKREDLAVAQALFDWTIRNVQLLERPQAKAGAKPTATLIFQQRLIDRQLPGDVLLYGMGTMEQRAWVFILLARQQKLDVVMLAVPDPDHPERPRPWLPALVHDGQLFLFDTSLGLAIPGPGGNGIATLSQAAEDESILNALDLDDSHHYPIKSADAKKAMAFIEASPCALTKRMKNLESQLVGDERIVFTANPQQIAKQLSDMPHLAKEVKLWTLPYDAYAIRQSEAEAPKQFKEILAKLRAPFTIPGFHGDRPTVLKPQERLGEFERVIAEGQTPNAKISTAITPGKQGNNARLAFQVKLPQAEFDSVSIDFQFDKDVTRGNETVAYVDKDARRPKIVFRIAEGKTTANDILRVLGADPVASQIVDAVRVGDSDGEGVIDTGDSVTTTRLDVKKVFDMKRPVQIVFPLWAARQLHFRGDLTGTSGAKHYYMASRPGDDQFEMYVNELLTDLFEATSQQVTPAIQLDCRRAMSRRKQAATFWLGMVNFEEGQFEAAEGFFKMVPVEKAMLPSDYLSGARYNLALTYQAEGRTDDAVKLLEADDSPQRHGNRLLARRLKATAKSTAAPASETKAIDSKSSDSPPADPKLNESKPHEAKAFDAKPVDTKPADVKPAESKPVEPQPTDKPPTDSKSTEPEPAKTNAGDSTKKPAAL